MGHICIVITLRFGPVCSKKILEVKILAVVAI
jgi:hypothetical protein